jgi:uncharacterized protein
MKAMDNYQIESWRIQFIKWLEVNWIHDDKAHDIHHLHRVWRNCKIMMQEEEAASDPLVLLAAAYFHDLITLPKSHPDRQKASWQSAEKTVHLLENDFPDFPHEKLAGIHHAIHAHSFSANIPTSSPEAEILQDADRMEALGAMGIARLFYTAGMMKSSLYHPQDPSGLNRSLDDNAYALDHIEAKLLKLPLTMKTSAGRRLAEKEAAFILAFKRKILEEISSE